MNEEVYKFFESNKKFESDRETLSNGLSMVRERLADISVNDLVQRRWKQFNSLLEVLKVIEETQLPALMQAAEFKLISSINKD